MFNNFLRVAGRALVVLLAAALPVSAQTGRITGHVTDAAKQPLVSAQVLINGTALGAETDANGKFTVTGLAAGTYSVRAQHIGHKLAVKAGVVVTAGQATTVDFALDATPVTLGGVVISASRRVEKITDAPATVSRLDALAIANS
ncbi:MAG: carboxypeptidase-like regulatory domain-containing protein, partial [Gemmatimonadota bacterium]|nr:carboxypeptidase-like regulatory domain-containing protein [Gemmatimonadota bacterium]